MVNPNDPLSWDKQGVHVLSEIKRCSDNIHGLRDDIQALSLKGTAESATIAVDISGLKIDIAGLKVRAQIWGGVMGCLGGAVGVGIVEVLARLIFKL